MRTIIYALVGIIMAQLISVRVTAQKTLISGTVTNSITQERVSAVTILLKNRAEATYSNDKGNFLLFISGGFPVTLTISSIGFETREMKVDNNNELVNITLKPVFILEKAMVFAATRTPTRFLESPVSIEQITVANIQRAAVPTFYESIANVKGVDLTTSSLTFRTVSTRGFNGSGNQRINQFMDGMDNQAPGLNFSVGNLLGMSEMDVESVELLPGASSALYGSGGLNGTLLMNSKNPFKYQGFSAQVKQGVMHLGNSDHNPSPYYDLSLRFAKAYDRFAFKVNAQFIKGQDWQAGDTRNLERTNLISRQKEGSRNTDPGYDGVNVYGDEVNINMLATTESIISQVTKAFKAQFRSANRRDPNAPEIDNFLSGSQYGNLWTAIKKNEMPNKRVSRSGFDEKDLVDYGTYNLKTSGGIYYKVNDRTEASVIGYWGTGTTVYTNADRYSLKGVKMGQYKAEVKNKRWFLRAYTTQENAGDAYNTTALASHINEAIKPSTQWFTEYLGAFARARSLGQPEANAHQIARSKADSGRLVPGSAAFNEKLELIRKTPISKGGALFLDKTDLWQFDGQLDLSEKIKVMEVLVGTSYRQYILNSEGTIFSDTSGRIRISEWGSFLQLQKALIGDVLKISASGRYDKSKNFDGQFTPRITALVKIANESNIRMSYQTAYRFPSTQDQYINLFTGTTTLIGSLPQFGEFYNFLNNPVYTAQSISNYRETGKTADLEKGAFNKLEPEKVNSFEIGYKSLINKTLLVDVYAYYSKFNNFIGRVAVGQPRSASTVEDDLRNSGTTKNFSYMQNVHQSVRSNGFGIGIEYKMPKNFIANLNASSDKIHNVPANIISFFNTPGFRFNAGIANDRVLKQFGFNLNYRWQTKVDWEGPFGTGPVPAYGTLDGQLSYKVPGTKNMIKLGASNLMNKYYYSAFGNPQVGGLYYMSFGYNVQ